MLNIYKFLSGTNRDPSVRVDYYTDELTFENPLHLVGSAGKGFDASPVHTLYVANDSVEIDYSDIIFLTIDQDTSDGLNEHSWIQYRVLIEYTNSLSQPESVWSDWYETLDWSQHVAGTINDSLGVPVTIGQRVLHYYKDATTGNPLTDTYIRDLITFQIRFSIPTTTMSQLKDDLTVAIRVSAEQNLYAGRPAT